MNDLLGGQMAAHVLPEVPSFAEQGYPNLVVKKWFAFFALLRTPKNTIASLSTALQEAIGRPLVRASFAKVRMTPV